MAPVMNRPSAKAGHLGHSFKECVPFVPLNLNLNGGTFGKFVPFVPFVPVYGSLPCKLVTSSLIVVSMR